jgi:hypothetical protein
MASDAIWIEEHNQYILQDDDQHLLRVVITISQGVYG